MLQPVALEGLSKWSALNTSDKSICILLNCNCGIGSSSICESTKSLVENTELNYWLNTSALSRGL